MLTDAQLELLTAAVDGVLPPVQEAALRRLVANSEEAKATFRHLLQNQRRLKAAKRHTAPAGLSKAVLARIPASKPLAMPARRPEPVHRFMPQLGWRPYAVAASLFFAIITGTFWLNAFYGEYHTATAQQKSLPRVVVDGEGREAPAVAIALDRRPETLPEPRPIRRPTSEDYVQVRPQPVLPELAPGPRPRIYDVIGSGVMTETPPRDGLQIHIPLLTSVAELDRTHIQDRLASDLAREHPFHLDLFARDTTKGMEALVAFAKTQGLTLQQEGWTEDRLRRKPQVSWVIYTEAMSGEELAKFLAALAAQERETKANLFTLCHFFQANHQDQKDLRDLLGVDPGLWKRPSKAPALPAKSLTSGTVDEVLGNLSKTPKTPASQAIALPYAPQSVRVPASSSKVKSFLEHRGERKAGAIPLMIVVKPLPG